MEEAIYEGLAPIAVWKHFAALNTIPRPSGHETAARSYVREVAEAARASWRTDAAGNAVARIPARNGGFGPIVAIQTHLDMVCEKEASITHDCLHDPIRAQREGDWVMASGTTLGADNGIGVAMSLALLTDETIAHGPLELVFTVEEEIGLKGAANFDASMIEAEMLINLDSEDDRSLIVGCAGGAELVLGVPLSCEPLAAGWRDVELRVSGLAGGHSGLEIHAGHANAIKLMGEALDAMAKQGIQCRLKSLNGGSSHNAIPRYATVVLSVEGGVDAMGSMATVVKNLHERWSCAEPNLKIDWTSTEHGVEAISAEDTATVVKTLLQLPHGALAISDRYEDTVETSANLAVARLEGNQLEVRTSFRSLTDSGLREAEHRGMSIEVPAAAEWRIESTYPSWEPRDDSPLVISATEAYRAVHHRPPQIEVLHAGLECGVIISRKPGLTAVSLGPLIEKAHSPSERMLASTVRPTYEVLVGLLAELAPPAA